jgi:alpha-galactosidase
LIHISHPYFHLATERTSYVMEILPGGHLGQLFYGGRISPRSEYPSLRRSFEFMPGAETAYSPDFPGYNLETAMLEYPGGGKGDYRSPAASLMRDTGDRVVDPTYRSHRIEDLPPLPGGGLPGTRGTGEGGAQLLTIELADGDLIFELRYRVLESCDVITRQARIVNGGQALDLSWAASLSLDLPPAEYRWHSLPGKWIAEKQLQSGPVRFGETRFSPRRLASSAEHNPFLAVSSPESTETAGDCYGFALAYSGNHRISVERSSHQLVRIQLGVSDEDFRWRLESGGEFLTPEAIMTFSASGFERMSRNFHAYISRHVIPPAWRNRPRPLLFNSWEALYFDVGEDKIMKLARAGAELGMELFVLDDGWFKGRNDDRSSLGDWTADRKKLPGGLEGLSKKVRGLGLEFGIWVEPEMVSPDSDLYREHPDWALTTPGREPSLGRNQLILDLCNPAVIDYLEASMNEVFRACRPAYVKWDMNRCSSDLYSPSLPPHRQGETAHRYILGLYELLERLTATWPEILFESCASGGNRFDAGMLYYMPQTWTSDNTDPGSRMKIQHGSSWLYPIHSAAAHVGSDPSHQLLRSNGIETRFHVAAFGALGYELNLSRLSPFEKKVIAKQVELYKEHRELFQFGEFRRLASPFDGNLAIWQMMAPDGSKGVLGLFQQLQEAGAVYETVRLRGLDPGSTYRIETLPHYINIARFGELINDFVPFEVRSSGIRGLAHKVISDNYLFAGEIRTVEAPGDELMSAGFRPYNQFNGTGYNERVRIMGDVSSRVYLITRLDSGSGSTAGSA